VRKLTYAQIEKIIMDRDPMGLLKEGAPSDEYHIEIEDLLQRRNRGNSTLSKEEIRVVFEYWFYPGCITPEICEEIAKELQSLDD